MADIRKAYLHAFEHGQALAIAAGAQKAERALGVLEVVDRLHGRSAGALGLARLPLRVRNLYVGAVAQHDLQKVASLLRGVDGAAEAAPVEQRQVAGMVDVGVRDETQSSASGRTGRGLFSKRFAPCSMPQSTRKGLSLTVKSVWLPVTSWAAPRNSMRMRSRSFAFIDR